MDDKKLINAAKDARERSYSPYSGFKVGAAVLTEEGKIYSGCNVENASYSLTICAERVAITKAISDGARKIEKIVIITDTKDITYPCGSCLQVLNEFNDKVEIIIMNMGKKEMSFKLSDLLPYAFNGKISK